MVELSLRLSADAVEAVSDALMDELDALSVSVEDADAGTADERALFGEPGMPPAAEPAWPRSIVTALFDDEAAATEAAAVLVAHLGAQRGAPAIEVLGIAAVPEEDWVRLTQAQFTPVAVTADFWIVPTWHEPPPEATRVIRLDPGLAFGTGTHPTTRLCLRWIAEQAPSAVWRRVLDYGCGSGILAIGAALHGAARVDAVDIDPAAIDAGRANAAHNRVAVNCGSPDIADGTYDLVLANILASPLTLLAPVLCSHLRPGADLVLAGILERQVDALRAAYAPWVELGVADSDDGWVLMTGCRAQAAPNDLHGMIRR